MHPITELVHSWNAAFLAANHRTPRDKYERNAWLVSNGYV